MIEIKNISKTYLMGKVEVKALDDLSQEFGKDNFLNTELC